MSRPVKREETEGENEEERGRSLHTAPGYDGTSTKFDQYEKLVDAYRRLGKLNKVPNAEIVVRRVAHFDFVLVRSQDFPTLRHRERS